MDSLREAAKSHKEEVDNLKSKLSNSKSRCDVLEKTVKDSKNQFALKMKVLIDKTENDDKLIGMLKAEIAKLEASKGVKSSLNLSSRGAGQTKAGVGSYDNEEISKLHQKVALYANDIKCLKVELDHKEDKI